MKAVSTDEFYIKIGKYAGKPPLTDIVNEQPFYPYEWTLFIPRHPGMLLAGIIVISWIPAFTRSHALRGNAHRRAAPQKDAAHPLPFPRSAWERE